MQLFQNHLSHFYFYIHCNKYMYNMQQQQPQPQHLKESRLVYVHTVLHDSVPLLQHVFIINQACLSFNLVSFLLMKLTSRQFFSFSFSLFLWCFKNIAWPQSMLQIINKLSIQSKVKCKLVAKVCLREKQNDDQNETWSLLCLIHKNGLAFKTIFLLLFSARDTISKKWLTLDLN